LVLFTQYEGPTGADAAGNGADATGDGEDAAGDGEDAAADGADAAGLFFGSIINVTDLRCDIPLIVTATNNSLFSCPRLDDWLPIR
jgi:hypothetical protein